jgi:hypothetical protein
VVWYTMALLFAAVLCRMRDMLRRSSALFLCAGLFGCDLIFGIEEGELSAPTGASGGGGTGGTAGGQESGGGGAGAGGAGAGGVGGDGGSGGSSSCEDGTACYTGDPSNLVPGALCKQGMWANCATTPTCVGEVLPASEDFAAPGDEDCDGKARGDFVFARELDGNVFNVQLTPGSSGSVFFTGNSNNQTFDLGGIELPGANNAPPFIVKFDASGTPVWQFVLSEFDGATMESVPLRVLPKPDGGALGFFATERGKLVIGSQSEITLPSPGLAVVSFSPSGQVSLETVFPYSSAAGTVPRLSDVVAMPDGKIVLGGYIGTTGIVLPVVGTVPPAVASRNAFLIGLNEDLTPAWFKTYGDQGAGNAEQGINRLAVSPDGSLYAAGSNSGNMFLVSNIPSTSGFVVKLQNSTEQWVAHGVGTSDLLATPTGVLLAGYHAGVGIQPGMGIQTQLQGPDGGVVWRLREGGLNDWTREYRLPPGSLAFRYRGSLASAGIGGSVFGATVQGSLQLEGETFNSQGPNDPILFKLGDDGSIEYSKHIEASGGFQDELILTPDLASGRVWTLISNGGTVDLGFGAMQPDNNTGFEYILASFEP